MRGGSRISPTRRSERTYRLRARRRADHSIMRGPAERTSRFVRQQVWYVKAAPKNTGSRSIRAAPLPRQRFTTAPQHALTCGYVDRLPSSPAILREIRVLDAGLAPCVRCETETRPMGIPLAKQIRDFARRGAVHVCLRAGHTVTNDELIAILAACSLSPDALSRSPPPRSAGTRTERGVETGPELPLVELAVLGGRVTPIARRIEV